MTDWIFPFFLFTVGVAVTLSFAKRIESGIPVRQLYGHIATRMIIIFALGLFLNGFPYFNFSELRIPGVLQRIAICYGITSIIFLHGTLRGQLYWITGLLGCYWLIMQYMPVPGIGSGLYEPGWNSHRPSSQIRKNKRRKNHPDVCRRYIPDHFRNHPRHVDPDQ